MCCGVVVQCRRHAIGIESSAEADGRGGPIEVVPHVLLTGPDHLDWLATHGFGDGYGLLHLVAEEAAPKTTAQEAVVHIDVLRRHLSGGRGGCQGTFRGLRANPD